MKAIEPRFQMQFLDDREKAISYLMSLPDAVIRSAGHLDSMLGTIIPEEKVTALLNESSTKYARDGWLMDIEKSQTVIVAMCGGRITGMLRACRDRSMPYEATAGKAVYTLGLISTEKGTGTALMTEYRRRFPNALTVASVDVGNMPALKLALRYCDVVINTDMEALSRMNPTNPVLRSFAVVKCPGLDMSDVFPVEVISKQCTTMLRNMVFGKGGAA